MKPRKKAELTFPDKMRKLVRAGICKQEQEVQ